MLEFHYNLQRPYLAQLSTMSRRKQQQNKQSMQSMQSGSVYEEQPGESGDMGGSRRSGASNRQSNSQSQASIADRLDQYPPEQIQPGSYASRQSQLQKSKASSAQDAIQYKPSITELQESAVSGASGPFIKKSRLREIQQEKERLKNRLNQLEQTEAKTTYSSSSSYQAHISHLLEKKQKMEEQRAASQAAIRRAEEMYLKKKQMATRAEMERIAREKVELERQILNRQTILDAAKLHTEGLDSKMLLNKALSRNISDTVDTAYPGAMNKGDLNYGILNTVGNRQAYDQALRQMERRALAKAQSKPPNLSQLNDKRMKIFAQQQKLIRKKIILKQMQAQDPQCWEKLQEMNEQQMDELLEKLGHEVDDFRNPLPRQLILDNIETIRDRAKERIQKHVKEQRQNIELKSQYQQALRIKRYVQKMNPQNVRFVKGLLNDIIDAGCDHYDRLLKRLDKASDRRKAEEANMNQFKKKERQQIDNTVCTDIVDQMLERIGEEMFQDGVEQIHKLHQLAWTKTFSLIMPGLHEKEEHKILKLISKYDIELQYSQAKPKIKYKQNTTSDSRKNTKESSQKLKTNIFDAAKETIELTPDVPVLEMEDNYFSNVKTKVKTIQTKRSSLEQLLFDKTLYTVTPSQICSRNKQIKIPISIQRSWRAFKFNLYWMLCAKDGLLILHRLDLIEAFSEHIGDRIGIQAGQISTSAFYPVTTILGSVCSILIGFKNGVILKYNLNRNPINFKQSNISFYEPLLDHIRTGEDPKLPNQHKQQIEYHSQKVSEEESLHEYRQFFTSPHTAPIIGITFYTPTQFITVDETLQCCLWSYERDDKNSYNPSERFEVKIELTGYRYPEKPVMKTIPLLKSPEQTYKDYFGGQDKVSRQIYVNPKNSEALYSKGKIGNSQEVLVQRILYSAQQERIEKIYQEVYIQKKIKAKGLDTRIWRGIIFILTKRPHKIKQDLQTVKIVGFDTISKKLKKICYEIDIYAKDPITDFFIVDSIIKSFEVPGVIILNAGRAMVFSMSTGQLVRIIVDQLETDIPQIQITKAVSNPTGLMFACNKKEIYQIDLDDENNATQKYKISKEYDQIKQSYFG